MSTDADIDIAIMDALAASLQSPPAILRSIFDGDDRFDELMAEHESIIKHGRRNFERWRNEGRQAQQDVATAFDIGPVKQRHLILLESVIDKIEENAVQLAKQYRRHKNIIRKQARRFERYSPRHAAVFRENMVHLFDQFGEEIDENTNAALFFRALLADHDLDKENGPVFDNPEDLGRHLEDVVRQ